ncbi:unnamed protein product [Ixodes pacificus]
MAGRLLRLRHLSQLNRLNSWLLLAFLSLPFLAFAWFAGFAARRAARASPFVSPSKKQKARKVCRREYWRTPLRLRRRSTRGLSAGPNVNERNVICVLSSSTNSASMAGSWLRRYQTNQQRVLHSSRLTIALPSATLRA